MSVKSRSKKPMSYDSIHITDFDADIDDFDFFSDDVRSNTKAQNNSKITAKPSQSSLFKSSLVDQTSKHSSKDNLPLKHSISQPTRRQPVEDDSSKEITDTISNTPKKHSAKLDEKILETVQSPDVNTVPPNSARSALSKKSDDKSMPSGGLRAQKNTTQQMTSSRIDTKTPTNQRAALSSSHTTKKNTSTLQNKNLKGAGHEANDLYIDDIEDF